MKCYVCKRVVPAQAKEANFCVGCGRPLKQICPYEQNKRSDGSEPNRLALYDDNGRATSACRCGGLFKACDTCHRLHILDEPKCLTKNCRGVLREPIMPFPTPTGPVSGTHTIAWPGSFTPFRDVDPQGIDRLQMLAFRYGLLIGVSRTHLLTFIWNGVLWQQRAQWPLDNGGEMRVHALAVEQGRVFVLGQSKAIVYTITGDLRDVHQEEEAFSVQVVTDTRWVRATPEGALLTTESTAWSSAPIPLPEEAGVPTCLAASGQDVYAATNKGFVFKVDPVTREATQLMRQECQWLRLAVSNQRIVALGRMPETRQLALTVVSTDGATRQGPEMLAVGSIADFAWAGNHIYICRERDAAGGAERFSGVDCYDAHNLTRIPTSSNLPPGLRTQTDMFAFASKEGETRLLLRRKNISSQKFYLADPAHSTQQDVGPFTEDPPLVCVADARLVIARHANEQTKLHTFAIEGVQ